MAEWFIEGFLQRLLDRADPIAKTLLKQTVFYVVPNMNPDGSVRGHLRANAAGIDLNRSWCAPSLEKSPEVFYVRQKMRETGVDLFLDIHGDEVIPYNFVAGAADNPSYSAKQAKLENTFISYFLQQSPDFQNEHGYGVRQFGEHTLTLATNYVADTFGCLALTVEMPFKDNANLPDEKYGWSPLRAKKLASACLDTIHQVVPLIA
jgi:murein tripeptide amidase MpaA